MADVIRDHLSQEFASDIKLILRDLKKILKVLTLYPDDNPLPTRMRRSFGDRFVELVDEFNGFTFSIRPDEIIYDREVVYHDQTKEEALASIFYNAGIVYLEFSEGLSWEEFNSFLDIVKTFLNNPSDDNDLVSLMWQEQFTHIKFKTVEDLALGEYQTDMMIREMYPDYGAENSLNSEIDYNQVILDEENDTESDSGSVSQQAIDDAKHMGLSLDSPPDDKQDVVDQMLSGSYTLADEEEREIRRLLEENRLFDPDRSTTRIMIEILYFWDDQKPFSETVGICEKIFDQLLTKGGFAAAANFVHVLRDRSVALADKKPTQAERLRGFILRAGDDRRIKALTDIVNRQEKVDSGSIELYLDSLGWESLTHITGMLGHLVSKEARLMVCKYLSERGKDRINIIANGLRDRRWYVTRNSAMILGRIGGDKAVEYLASAAGHPDHRVRKEIIRALGKETSDRAVDLLFKFLKDSEPKLRAMALNYLGRMGGRRSFESIHEIIHSSSFSGYTLNEQEQFLIVYARLGGAEVIDFFASVIGAFSLFNAGWKARYRLMALKALAFNTSEEAEKLILKYTRSKRAWLRQAAVNAMEQHRKFVYRGEGKRR